MSFRSAGGRHRA